MRALPWLLAAGLCAATLSAGTSTSAQGPGDSGARPDRTQIQVLAINDFHGHLEATDGPLAPHLDPSRTSVGGVAHLAAHLQHWRSKVPADASITVGAGDLIGASPFTSGIFHDEPTIEALNKIDLSVSSIGNHELDEGTAELRRIQSGGCHPTDGCSDPENPYQGAHFPYLGANIYRAGTTEPAFSASAVREIAGVRVGFIGVTLRATGSLVSPAGVGDVTFGDEAEAVNREVAKLRTSGVRTIAVLVHEGGVQQGGYRDCAQLSGPIVELNNRFDSEVDLIVSGHTHQPYSCRLPDPAGNSRIVTSAADYGRVLTQISLSIDTVTGDVDRGASSATNHLVTRDLVDPELLTHVQRWQKAAAPRAGVVVGSVAHTITGGAGGDRGTESPLANVIADAFSGADRSADLALINTGGVRAILKHDQISATEQPGEITYSEAYAVLPFSNSLVAMDLTGEQLLKVLEQQYQPIPGRGSRPMLALGVSNQVRFSWDATKPAGSRVVPGSLQIKGSPVVAGKTYRVVAPNFLADGGDLFTALTLGVNREIVGDDLPTFINHLKRNPGLSTPEDRIDGM